MSVAGMYAAQGDDIVKGTRTAPDFEQARRLAHLVDDLRASSLTESGRRA